MWKLFAAMSIAFVLSLIVYARYASDRNKRLKKFLSGKVIFKKDTDSH